MTSTLSKTFCVLPWIHISTRTNGHMRVCCAANASSVQLPDSSQKIQGGEVGVMKLDGGKPANLNYTGLMDAWNGEYMRAIRLKMLNGNQPESCIKCYKEESAGVRSKRQWETEYWASKVDINTLIENTNKQTGWAPPTLYYLDLRLGSKCQLQCVMCSPHDSSAWIPSWQKLYPKIQNPKLQKNMGWEDKGRVNGQAAYNWHLTNPTFWEDLRATYPFLKQLYFAGGEALITNTHYEILEDIIARGFASNIELRYNSNGLVIPHKLLRLWDSFANVKFHFSIDGSERTNQWIRWPSDWQTVKNNLHLLDQTNNNIVVTTACTIQNINAFDLPRLCEWKLQQGFKKINPWPMGAGLLNMHFAYFPPQLNIKSLPLEIKKRVRSQWEDEFFPWLESNWQLSTALPSAVGYDQWRNHPYGIKRWQGILDFMDKEDWSERWGETLEWLELTSEYQNKPHWTQVFPELNNNSHV